MHDIKVVRADPQGFDAAMARRGLANIAAELNALDQARRDAIALAETETAGRNTLNKAIGVAMKQGDTAEVERLRASVRASLEAAVDAQPLLRQAQLDDALGQLPNILAPDVPEGRDEAANLVLHIHGTPADLPSACEHWQLGEALGLMDFEAAARLSGSRFVVLKGALARLERALGQWMLNLHVDQHGYTEVAPPMLVKAPALFGTGQLPKFGEDLFSSSDHYLIPTAEVPLTNLVANQVIPEPLAPLRFAALTACFRSEAGSAGRDTRGMLRQHQFQKVELVSITRPEDSAAEHERMTACAERVLSELGLTWRRMLLCAGDTGFSAAKTYDLEVWLPGQKAWREISSCSNTRDFQARRMKARFKRGKEMVLPHTLNGSGVAVGRALIAVLETHQQPDGSIAIPEVLRPFMGLDHIR